MFTDFYFISCLVISSMYEMQFRKIDEILISFIKIDKIVKEINSDTDWQLNKLS